LAICEKASGCDQSNVAAVLNNLASLYQNQGRLTEAEPLLQRALAIREKALSRDNPEVATFLNNLALLYHAQGRYAEAVPLLQRALAIREKVLGRDDPDVATSLNNLAALYQSQGRHAEALPLYERALSIWEKTLSRDDARFGPLINNLAALYREQGRYAEAERFSRRSLDISEKASSRDHPVDARALTNQALLYDSQGRYAEAEQFFRRALAIQEETLGRDHPDVGRSLNNLADLYRGQGRYAEAESLYRRALDILEKSPDRDHPDYAVTLNNLALLYKEQGRYDDAEFLYRRSLAIAEKALGREHPEVAAPLNNLAELYRDRGRHGDAEGLFQRSLAIQERTLGREHPQVARLLSNLARLHQGRSRYADAERLYQRALAIQEKTLGREHPDVAQLLNNLADLYRAQGRYTDALPIVKRMLAEATANKLAAFPVLLAARTQKLISPAQAVKDSYEIVQRASSSAAGTAVSRLAARFAAGTGEHASLVRKDQDLTAEAESLDKQVIAFVSRPPAERNAAAEDQIRKRIEAVKAEREKIARLFNARFPDYVALSRPQPVSIEETQALLADDEALLVFDFDATSHAWIVTRNAADWAELGVSARDLAAQVRALRALLTDPRQRFDPALAYKIYQEVSRPFADRIAAKKRLSIVTNEALTSLPPQLLITRDPSGKPLKEMDWLIRTHAVTILPLVASLKVLRGGSPVSSARKPLIAFADPVFSKAAARAETRSLSPRSITSFYRGTAIDLAAMGAYLPQLPGTRREVRQVATELGAAEEGIRLGAAATETAVKNGRLDQYRIVYFATHGLVAGDLEPFAKSKAEPALVLSIPDRPSDFDDGLLTASEIAQLKLDADWAVLSACNTAAEGKPGAEALSGLARAFFYAGARSLIVSHWEVEDEATASLMVGTFRALTRNPKLSHAEALRQSMLAMIDAAKSDREASPQVWAPFVVVGEPR
jgi:tetratricopeptide (TPR) repeat protein